MGVAHCAVLPAKVAHQREGEAGMWRATRVERLLGEGFEAFGLGRGVVGEPRFHTHLFELDSQLQSFGVGELFNETKTPAGVRKRFGVREQLQAAVAGDDARLDRHGRVSAHGRMVREFEGEGAVRVGASLKQPGHPKVHQLATWLGDFGVHDLVHESVVEAVHARRSARALEERVALELTECVHQRVELEGYQLCEAFDSESQPQHSSPAKHVARFRGEPGRVGPRRALSTSAVRSRLRSQQLGPALGRVGRFRH